MSQPNFLSAEPVVPELLQDDAQPARLGQELYCLLRHGVLRERQLEQFARVRAELRSGFAARAAGAVAGLLERA